MANDLLIQAIRESGLDIDAVADLAQVDRRTVQRWLAGRTPHPRYRHALATALHLTPADLWPDAVTVRRRSDLEEITGAWRRATQADAPDWRALLRASESEIDLLGYSLSRILTTNGIAKQLAAKAKAGCRIRIAVADPDSDPVHAADLAQRPSGRLTQRVRAGHNELRPLATEAGIECRQHRVATSHTILRFDDQMLLTLHLRGVPGSDAPLLQLRRVGDYGIFDQLLAHFDAVWETASPLEAGAPVATAPSAEQVVKDKMLEELDYVWRPGR